MASPMRPTPTMPIARWSASLMVVASILRLQIDTPSSGRLRIFRNNGPRGGTRASGLTVELRWRAGRQPARADARVRRERLSSVATSIRLLKAFSEDDDELGISELSRRLGLAKSTVHRLAVTLVSEGLLEQDRDNGKYHLGIALFRLGALVRRRMNVSNEARPYLYDLREKINETVHLAILDGTEIMYVYNLESTQAIRMRSDIGVRKPAHCTAEGQAILAFQPPELIDRVVAAGLASRTPKTITTAEKFTKRRLGRVVRQRGCAIDGRGERARHGVHRGADPRRQRRAWLARRRRRHALGAGDRRVMGRHLAGQHRLRERRLLIGLAVLVVEQQHVGRGVLLLGGERRRDPRGPPPTTTILRPVLISASVFPKEVRRSRRFLTRL